MDQEPSSLAYLKRATGGPTNPATTFHSLLILSPVLLASYVMMHVESEFNDILFNAIADAYIQVSTFVAGTLFIFYGIERVFKVDAAALLRTASSRRRLFFSAFLCDTVISRFSTRRRGRATTASAERERRSASPATSW